MGDMKKITVKDIIQDLRTNVYCRLKPSPFHGVGVFAIRDIPKGIDPFPSMIDISEYHDDYKVPIDKVMNDPAITDSVKEMIRDFYPVEDGFVYLPQISLNDMNLAYYINHSPDHPNLSTEYGDIFITTRDIKEGEELLADYRTYGDE